MLRITLFLLVFCLIPASLSAKPPKSKKNNQSEPLDLEEVVVSPINPITAYQAAKTRVFDLIHTKIQVSPVRSEKRLYGKAELILKPYYYPQSTLTLDAKGMFINSVQLKRNDSLLNLSYVYDSLKLRMALDRTYTRDEEITVVIDYVSRPYELDSAMSEFGRGVYMIDAEDKNPYKPYHLWSQGEEEAGSVWFPTIDATNERCTGEIYLTVDSALITLSNGILIESKVNANGTRTDHWLQDKPHAPYLFFIAAGPYQKYTTSWKDREVSYYTFPQYFDGVADLFRNTPEMLQVYSDKLGVEFPWDKLSNIVAWDYTAGAMENTSAIIYYDPLFCKKEDLVDWNFDYIIGHEIFHQWFGDYVTCESWANIPLNESLADYGEYIWMEHKYGRDFAEAYNQESLDKYLSYSILNDEPAFNFYYQTAHDLFDPIRYEKGGRILQLLRSYVGDEAFFASLKKYLQDNRYGAVELANLRLAFEAVTGQDLTWFFNQWWLQGGHPVLDIRSAYNAQTKAVELTVTQKQAVESGTLYRLPVKVDLYFADGQKKQHTVDITDREMSFSLPAKTQPLLVNFDADKTLPAEKEEHLSIAENIYKFQHGPRYLDRREAVAALSSQVSGNTSVQDLVYEALADENWFLRRYTLDQLEPGDFDDKNKLLLTLQQMAGSDPVSQVRHKALLVLLRADRPHAKSICQNVIDKDSSFLCIAAAIDKLAAIDYKEAYQVCEKYRDTENAYMLPAVARVFADSVSAENLAFLKKAIWMNSYRSFGSNYKSIRIFLKFCDMPLFEDGVQFLADVNRYEETDLFVKSAAKTLDELRVYFQARLIDKKTAAAEKPSITKKLELLEKVCAGLRSRSMEYHH